MRTVFLTTASLLAVCFIGTAFFETASFSQTIARNYASLYAGGAYGASACSGPAYCGPLEPGCCEYAPSCRCDDIWAGYCQEKNSGCGWPGICRPSIKRCFSRPCNTTSVCSPDCQPTCGSSGPCRAEPVTAGQGDIRPTNKTVRPAPTLKPAPAKPASTTDASSAWRFMPSVNTLRR